jgi:hypothetical protein
MRIAGVIGILLFFITSKAQDSMRKYFFKEVGWTMYVPAGFRVMDSAEIAVSRERGKQKMEDVSGVKLDHSSTRTLISASKSKGNFISATIRPYDAKRDGDFSAFVQGVKANTYLTLAGKLPDVKLDSVSSRETIDGLSFEKFRMWVTIEGRVVLNSFLLMRLQRGYEFGITYLYMTDEAKNEIEGILKGSRFEK